MDVLKLFSEFDWITFLIAMSIVELTPGPNMGWLATLSAQKGRRTGFTAVIGITLGLLVQLIAAATGLSAVISNSAFVYDLLRWGGIAFMLYLAWEAFRHTGSATPTKASDLQDFARGFIANILNPKALLFYIIIVGQFARPDLGDLWWQIIILGLIHLIVSVIIHVSIVLLGASLGTQMEQWQKSIYTRSGFALILVLMAIWIAISTG